MYTNTMLVLYMPYILQLRTGNLFSMSNYLTCKLLNKKQIYNDKYRIELDCYQALRQR